MSRSLLLVALAVGLAACGSDDAADESTTLSEAADAIEPMPPASESPAAPSVSGATLVDRVAEAPELTTLRRLLRESGLADDLSAEGPFTLFAPSDEAFAAVAELPEDPAEVRDLLLGHVLEFRITALDMDIEQTVESMAGTTLTLAPGSPPAVSAGASRAQVIRPDLDAANGVVHVVDAVLR